MPASPSPIDYRALIADRKQKQKRAIVRHIICLDPTLFAELEQLTAEHAASRYLVNDEDLAADVRLGGPSLPSRISALEARIAEASVVGVFKAPTASRQAELNNEADDADDPLDSMRTNILATFQHFEASREPIPADRLGVDDLADLLPEMSQGELISLSNRILQATAGAPDLPLSVRRLLLNQRSVATSKRRSSSAPPANGSTAGSPAPATPTPTAS